MKNFKRKLLGIPVWVVALMLVVGSVAGASIWILTVNVPVDYHEPVEIYYTSESMDSEVGPLSLRDTISTNPSDMTYGTLHDYVRARNPSNGKDSIDLEVTIQAYDDTDETTTDIGFVVLQGHVDPQDVTWTYTSGGERDTANGQAVQWGSTTFTHTGLVDGTEVKYTIINVAADGVDVTDYTIEWTVSEINV